MSRRFRVVIGTRARASRAFDATLIVTGALLAAAATVVLVVRWDEIWSDALSVPALDRLETALSALSEADRTLQAWAATGESFDARLEITGPARCLRALTTSPRPLRVTVNNPRITVSIDISDGLVVGADAERVDVGP